jgi:dihydrofolate reductase
MKFSIIAAADEKMGIGIGNSLPWRLKGDLKYFSDVTTGAEPGKVNAVIMGRKTWESLPEAHRPLKGRINVILSRSDIELPQGAIHGSSLEDAMSKLDGSDDLGKVFIIGGASLYAQAINNPDCEAIYLTEVRGEFRCDAFFPYIPDSIYRKESESKEQEENGVKYVFSIYRRID